KYYFLITKEDFAIGAALRERNLVVMPITAHVLLRFYRAPISAYPANPPQNRIPAVTIPAPGAIDCDIHPALPGTHVLVPYLDDYWRAHVQRRGLGRANYNPPAF